MAYKALYRTYRPKHFSEVLGQDHVVRTLLNAIKQGKTGHAYLFSGPRGTGKTTIARLLARAINCQSPVDGEPCGECGRCVSFTDGVGVLEIDAASHGSVDDMRTLVAQVSQIPLSGGMLVYIIDEVHMLSKEAFNAFLKTLEEPPPHAVFVLATTEPGKLLPTIHSRCQHFAFRRLPLTAIAEHIRMICEKEGIPAEENALRLIARAGDGSVRDSISVLEQAIAFEPEGLTLKGVRDVLGIPDRIDIRMLSDYILNTDVASLSSSYAKLIESGREPGKILTELLEHFRDLLFAAINVESVELTTLPDEEKNLVMSQAKNLRVESIHGAISFLAKIESEIKWEDEAALILEASLFRLASRFGREEIPRESKPERSVPPPVKKEPGIEKKTGTAPRKSLTGGISIKKPDEPETYEAPKPQKPAETKKPGKKEDSPDEKVLLNIPDNIEKPWLDIIEKIRKNSVADYILLAESTPVPAVSEWKAKGKNSEILDLKLQFPGNRGVVVQLLSKPSLLNRLTTSLEKILDRTVELSVALDQSAETGGKPAMVDGEGPVSSPDSMNEQSLFSGAGRVAPSDPVQKEIHNLIVDAFPDYNIEHDTGTSGSTGKPAT